ncbi:hypothetical protein BO79DRAFT_228767 [Aspergillus costaricaensis CBS 115574]|uniref:Uncharacterized protein n=1 Tax=Aspergillus costaricaensis CBS 115574 TaxID=1448317 RepID=A0ACD1IEK1_9EURO|nr:hypothetical protein BO79DRAFT_228767 [Aspergillus costaricaensis CBS 115574]RAK88208.1 hypothetical protein BO79DRAFT_228767 [Aspergillus costaricaensis CBS 115574]
MVALTSSQREAILNGPAGYPPAGKTANLTDPPNMHTIGRIVHLILFIVASLCFIIRIYTKACVVRHVRMSDYMMIIAWLGFIGYFVPAWLLGNVAPGVDQWNMTMRDFIKMLYYFRVGSVLYGICIFFIKASILLQLVEIFCHRKDTFYWVCHTVIWINLLFYVISTFVEIFSCRPMAAAWDVLISGKCMNVRLLNVIASSVNGFFDLIILILPQTRIWRLQMALRRKLAVSTVFLFGILACASAITRLAYAVLLFTTTNNIAYYSYMAGLWTLPELVAGIIAGCLPSSPKFFQKLGQNKVMLKWGSSLQNLLVSRGGLSQRRGHGGGRLSGNSYMMEVPKEDSKIKQQQEHEDCKRHRQRKGPPDQYPLTSFASAPGTIDQSTSDLSCSAERLGERV